MDGGSIECDLGKLAESHLPNYNSVGAGKIFAKCITDVSEGEIYPKSPRRSE